MITFLACWTLAIIPAALIIARAIPHTDADPALPQHALRDGADRLGGGDFSFHSSEQ